MAKVLYIVISLDILTAILALLVLKPVSRRWLEGRGAAKAPPMGRIAEA